MHEGSVSGYQVNPGQGRTVKVKEEEPWKLFKRRSIMGGQYDLQSEQDSGVFSEQEKIIRSLWKEG